MAFAGEFLSVKALASFFASTSFKTDSTSFSASSKVLAAAALAANGSVKKAKDFVEARTGTAEERRTLSAV